MRRIAFFDAGYEIRGLDGPDILDGIVPYGDDNIPLLAVSEIIIDDIGAHFGSVA